MVRNLVRPDDTYGQLSYGVTTRRDGPVRVALFRLNLFTDRDSWLRLHLLDGGGSKLPPRSPRGTPRHGGTVPAGCCLRAPRWLPARRMTRRVGAPSSRKRHPRMKRTTASLLTGALAAGTFVRPRHDRSVHRFRGQLCPTTSPTVLEVGLSASRRTTPRHYEQLQRRDHQGHERSGPLRRPAWPWRTRPTRLKHRLLRRRGRQLLRPDRHSQYCVTRPRRRPPPRAAPTSSSSTCNRPRRTRTHPLNGPQFSTTSSGRFQDEPALSRRHATRAQTTGQGANEQEDAAPWTRWPSPTRTPGSRASLLSSARSATTTLRRPRCPRSRSAATVHLRLREPRRASRPSRLPASSSRSTSTAPAPRTLPDGAENLRYLFDFGDGTTATTARHRTPTRGPGTTRSRSPSRTRRAIPARSPRSSPWPGPPTPSPARTTSWPVPVPTSRALLPSSVCSPRRGRPPPRRRRRAVEVGRRGQHRPAAVSRRAPRTTDPAAWNCSSASRSSTRVHRAPEQVGLGVERRRPTRRSGRVAKMASSSAISVAGVAGPARAASAKRSSSSHSGRPTARASAGQWRSPSRPDDPERGGRRRRCSC